MGFAFLPTAGNKTSKSEKHRPPAQRFHRHRQSFNGREGLLAIVKIFWTGSPSSSAVIQLILLHIGPLRLARHRRPRSTDMRSRGLALTLAICPIRGVALFKAPRHPSAARPGLKLKDNRKLNNTDRRRISRGLDSSIMSDKVVNQETPLISNTKVNDDIQSLIATPQWFRDMFDFSRNKPLAEPAAVLKFIEVVVSKFVLEVLGASGKVESFSAFLSFAGEDLTTAPPPRPFPNHIAKARCGAAPTS